MLVRCKDGLSGGKTDVEIEMSIPADGWRNWL